MVDWLIDWKGQCSNVLSFFLFKEHVGVPRIKQPVSGGTHSALSGSRHRLYSAPNPNVGIRGAASTAHAGIVIQNEDVSFLRFPREKRRQETKCDGLITPQHINSFSPHLLFTSPHLKDRNLNIGEIWRLKKNLRQLHSVLIWNKRILTGIIIAQILIQSTNFNF